MNIDDYISDGLPKFAAIVALVDENARLREAIVRLQQRQEELISQRSGLARLLRGRSAG